MSLCRAFEAQRGKGGNVTRERSQRNQDPRRRLEVCCVLFIYLTLFCFILFYLVLFCFVLFCFVLFCFVLFCFVLCYFVLF